MQTTYAEKLSKYTDLGSQLKGFGNKKVWQQFLS